MVLVLFTIKLTCVQSQNIKFYLSTDRETVQVGESFVFQAVLENADGVNLKIPDLEGFKIIQGPSTSTSMSIINGSQSSSMAIQYMLLATKKGNFSLGPATIQIKNKTLTSGNVIIQVLEATNSKELTGIDTKLETFIKIESTSDAAFIGQQIVLSYVLYTRQDISSYQLINEPVFSGFYEIPLQDVSEQPQRKTIDGKEYHRQVLKKVILFPQKIGKYSFGTIQCFLDIPIDGRRSSFFYRDVKREQISTNALNINVKPLPQPSPESFTGGVGNFQMTTSINKSNFVTGESIVIKMIVSGIGDPKIVQPPKLEKIKGIDSYEASIIKDESMMQGDKIEMEKHFEYILVPTVDSQYIIEPKFSYFSVENGGYVILKSELLHLNVLKGSSKIPSLNETEKNLSLSPMIKDISLTRKNDYFFGSSSYFISIFGIVFIFLGGLFYKNWKLKNEEAAFIQSNSIDILVKKYLKNAYEFMINKADAHFYVEISKATIDFTQIKLGLENFDANKDTVIQNLYAKNFPESMVEDYKNIQQRCEMAKFGGKNGEMLELYQLASDYIKKFEELPK